MVEDGTPSNGTQAMLQREMADAVVRAQKTVNRYTHQQTQLALYGQAPGGAPTNEKLVEAHSAVMGAFQMMREYIKSDVDGIWNETVIGHYRGRPVYFGAPPQDTNAETAADGGEELYLSDFHNAVETHLVEDRERFERRPSLYEVVKPKLLNIDAYQNAVDCLMYALKDTKFAPQAGMKDIQDDEGLFFEDEEPEVPT